MAKYVMLAQSEPVEGREDEYNAWQDNAHIKDVLGMPGVTSAQRLEATPIMMGGEGRKYMTIYEIETDDPGAFIQELGKRSHDGTFTRSEANDAAKAVLWIYRKL
jgi:hypothetical protein